jgi:ribosome maturation factor RimP
MQTSDIIETLKEQLKPVLAELKTEIVELTLRRESRGLMLRLIADKAGGITIDECALINNRLGDIIDEKGLIDDRYFLEVCSPGLDRPLRNKLDFDRVLGKAVDIWVSATVLGVRFLRGVVKRAEEESVIVERDDHSEVAIPYNIIDKARLNLKLHKE